MKVLTEGRTSYPQDPTRYFDFAQYANQCGNFLLAEGIFDFSLLEKLQAEKVVYLEFEEPNRFFASRPSFNHIPHEASFDKIFTICPYTAKWLNEIYGNNKRVPVYFPFNEKYIPQESVNNFDIIYTGHINSPNIMQLVKAMTKYNYCLVSNSDSSLVTHRGVSYVDKLKLIAQSKITLTHNLLFPSPGHIYNVNQHKDFTRNPAFQFVPHMNLLDKLIAKMGLSKKYNEVMVPQLKSRLFEAAFCRSLIVCRRDPWNLVERFFEPDKEFIYYEDGKLEETIDGILKHYNDYKPIIENAFQKAINNYTTEHFFQTYLKDIKY